MEDITYCTNQKCEDRRYCQRGKEVVGQHSFAEFDDDGCEYYLPLNAEVPHKAENAH